MKIDKDNLGFYFGDLRKKESREGSVVSAMPFNLSEIDDLNKDKKWERLKDLSVEFLKEKKTLPSFAKEQDYERAYTASYISFRELSSIADSLSKEEGEKDKKPIEIFGNVFDNIVLPPGYKERIIETVSQLKDYKKIFEEWGLSDKIKRGKGINLLFTGASGTGKTYCGEIIAEYLGTTCEIVSVASFETKWVGESERNIANIFRSLSGNNKVLILDEVDSFLSGRGNSEQIYYTKLTNQFLIEMERHNGVCIMTTNRPVVLDRALQRRIDLILDFPFPNKQARRAIWQYHIPKKMPLGKLDFDKLSEMELNGGLIKNVVLGVARKAVTRNVKRIGMDLFLEASREELLENEIIKNGKDHSIL